MQEAFRKAIIQNPNSPISPVVRGVHQAQATEAFRLRYAKRNKQFHDLGLMWVDTKANVQIGISYGNIRMSIEQRIAKWKQALTSLKNIPSEERTELLVAMALGMQLTGDRVLPVYVLSVLQKAFDNPFSFFRDRKLGGNFTPQSMLFMEAISDMSGHSGEQKKEFIEFMVKDSGLKGKVELPQLLPAISQWLDDSNPRSPSHSSNA